MLKTIEEKQQAIAAKIFDRPVNEMAPLSSAQDTDPGSKRIVEQFQRRKRAVSNFVALLSPANFSKIEEATIKARDSNSPKM